MGEVVPLDHGAESLPALIDRAAQRLLDAKTSGEVLEAKKVAEAALALAKVTKAANETHADCLLIITRAESRMADEVDKGQAHGEIATKGDRKSPSLGDLGVDDRRLSEWRETRDAGEEVVKEAIQTALDEGRAPTKADIKRHIQKKPKPELKSEPKPQCEEEPAPEAYNRQLMHELQERNAAVLDLKRENEQLKAQLEAARENTPDVACPPQQDEPFDRRLRRKYKDLRSLLGSEEAWPPLSKYEKQKRKEFLRKLAHAANRLLELAKKQPITDAADAGSNAAVGDG